MSDRLLATFEATFEGKRYLHRDSSLGDFVAMHLYEDLYTVGKSALFRRRADRKERVLNVQNRRTGIQARRGDGTFGELIPTAKPIEDPGFRVARGPVAKGSSSPSSMQYRCNLSLASLSLRSWLSSLTRSSVWPEPAVSTPIACASRKSSNALSNGSPLSRQSRGGTVTGTAPAISDSPAFTAAGVASGVSLAFTGTVPTPACGPAAECFGPRAPCT